MDENDGSWKDDDPYHDILVLTPEQFSNYGGLFTSEKDQNGPQRTPKQQDQPLIGFSEADKPEKAGNEEPSGLIDLGKSRIGSLLGLKIQRSFQPLELQQKPGQNLPSNINQEQPTQTSESAEELDDVIFIDAPCPGQERWKRCNTLQSYSCYRPTISSPISTTTSVDCLTRFDGWEPEKVNEILEELKSIIRELNRLGEKPGSVFKEIEKPNGTFHQLYTSLEKYDDVARVAALQNQMFMLINSTCCKTVKNKMILLMEKMAAVIEGNPSYTRRKLSRVGSLVRTPSFSLRRASGENSLQRSFHRPRRNTDPYGSLPRFIKNYSSPTFPEKNFRVTFKSLTEEFIDLTKSEIWESRYGPVSKCRRCSASAISSSKKHCFINCCITSFIVLCITIFLFLLVLLSLCTYSDMCPAWSTKLCDNWFQGHCSEQKLNNGHIKEHLTLKNMKRPPDTHRHTHDH